VKSNIIAFGAVLSVCTCLAYGGLTSCNVLKVAFIAVAAVIRAKFVFQHANVLYYYWVVIRWASSQVWPTWYPKTEPVLQCVLTFRSVTKYSRARTVDPGGHFISMGVWGFAGYWAYKWETYSGHLLDVKRAEIADRRRRLMDQADEASGVAIVGDRPVLQSH